MRHNVIRPVLILLFFAVCQWVTSAQTNPKPVVLANSEKRELTSKKIGQTYELLVSLPADYATSGKRYPVLYVLDGWHFPLMAFLQNNNAFSERMPPVIIVNVSHGDLEWSKVRPIRSRDFTPTPVKEEPGSGGAAAFLDFFEHELMPFVDRTYRTDTTDRGLLGHSYGGVFAIYALEHRPELFQRIVAASPIVGWDHRLLFSGLDHLKIPSYVRLDISVGSEETVGNEVSDCAEFAKLLDSLKLNGLEYQFHVYNDENHNSVRLTSFPAGLYWVYQSPAIKLQSK